MLQIMRDMLQITVFHKQKITGKVVFLVFLSYAGCRNENHEEL